MLCFIKAGDWHCVSIIFFGWATRLSVFLFSFFLCLCLVLFVCMCFFCLCLWNANVMWIPVRFVSRNSTGLCCQVWTGASPLGPVCSLKIYSCGSGYPTLPRTVGAQCERHRRSDDILPTSQSLTLPETSTSDRMEIDHSFLCSLSPSPFLFLYLFDIWLAGRDVGKPPFRVGHFGLWLV